MRTQVLGFVASTVIDVALFAVAFRLLTAAQLTARQVLPGASLAAAFWLGLQARVGVFVTSLLAGSTQSYGGFAAVIALLFWLLIAPELILIAAELNVVLVHRAWPRSLAGELVDADKQALRASPDRRRSTGGSSSRSTSNGAAGRAPRGSQRGRRLVLAS